MLHELKLIFIIELCTYKCIRCNDELLILVVKVGIVGSFSCFDLVNVGPTIASLGHVTTSTTTPS